MPAYNYRCKQCGKEEQKIVAYEDRLSISCDCGSAMAMLLPNMSNDSVAVYELVDKDRGKQVMRNIGQIMKDRAKQHKQDQESGEFVEKNGGMRAVMQGYLDPDKKTIIKEK